MQTPFTSHFIRLFARNLKQHAGLTILNILGLSVGVTAGMLIYLWVVDEFSYDRFHQDYEQIYRIIGINTESDGQNKTTLTDLPLPAALKRQFPQVQNAVAVSCQNRSRDFMCNQNLFKLKTFYTSENFFQVFDFPVIRKSDNSFFPTGSSLVISSACARQVFGTTDCLGKELTMHFYGRTRFIIAGVVDVPSNSHLQFDVLMPFSSSQVMQNNMNRWNAIKTVNYLRLKSNASFTKIQYQAIQHILAEHSGRKTLLSFQPLKDIHLHSHFADRFTTNNGDIIYVGIFIFATVLLIIMVHLNFIILSVAHTEKRRKEIAVKKLFGSHQSTVLMQFLFEALNKIAVAYLPAIILTAILLPAFNSLTGKQLVLDFNRQLIYFLFGAFAIAVMLSFIYLAFYLSSLKPADLLGGVRFTKMRSYLNRYLLPVQMFTSIFFILAFFTIFDQLRYMQQKDKGIDPSDILAFKSTGMIYSYENIKHELLQNPDILSVTASGLPPVNYSADKFRFSTGKKGEFADFVIYFADPAFAETFGLKMKQGDFLPADMNRNGYFRSAYINDNPVVFNQTAAKATGLGIGDKFTVARLPGKARLTGIVEDFHFRPLKYAIDPMLIVYNPEAFSEMYVKFRPGTAGRVLKFAKEVTAGYRKGNYTFDYYFLDELIDQQYTGEVNMLNLSSVLMTVSVVISLFGVISMGYYSMVRRRRDTAIRKTFGARWKDLFTLAVKSVFTLVVVAYLSALVLAIIALQGWLNNYSYRIALPMQGYMMIFLLVMLLVSLVTLMVTISENRRNPVESLRYE